MRYKIIKVAILPAYMIFNKRVSIGEPKITMKKAIKDLRTLIQQSKALNKEGEK